MELLSPNALQYFTTKEMRVKISLAQALVVQW